MKPPIMTLSPVCTKLRVLILPSIEASVSAKIVHFHETNSGHVVYATHNRGVVAWWQICKDRRFEWIRWSVAAVLNIDQLVLCDNTADYRLLPIIIRAD